MTTTRPTKRMIHRFGDKRRLRGETPSRFLRSETIFTVFFLVLTPFLLPVPSVWGGDFEFHAPTLPMENGGLTNIGADPTNGSSADIAASNENFTAPQPTLLASAQPFDFSLSGTGEGSGTTEPPLTDWYQYQREGNQSFFVPKSAISDLPIAITATAGWKGPSADGAEVYILYGDCRITQGTDVAAGPKAVLWLRRKESQNEAGRDEAANKIGGNDKNAQNNPLAAFEPKEALVYLEKENQWEPLHVQLTTPYTSARTNDMAWLGSFRTTSEIDLHISEPGASQLEPEAIFRRANLMKFGDSAPNSSEAAKRSDTSIPPISENDSTNPNGATLPIPQTSRASDSLSSLKNKSNGKLGFRRIRPMSRYDVGANIETVPDPVDPSKSRWIISNGFTLIIEGIMSDGKTVSDVIDISADNVVIWGPGIEALSVGNDSVQSEELDLELYLEGDIVCREGERVVYAQKMYYDVKNRVGLIMDTEVVLPVPETAGGWFRVKADSILQRGPDSLSAENAWISTSMMGYPSYRLQSNSLTAESRHAPLFDAATRQPLIDPTTGKQQTKTTQYVIAQNNFVALESAPVFYWPWMAMDTRDQSLYLRNVKVGNDKTFGTQIRTKWNPYQIFNISKCRPEGTDWDIDLDYLSQRGLGHGTSFLYNRDSIFGMKTPAIGMMNFYGIHDSGTDNLGLGRRNVPLSESYRYRGIWKHRQMFELPGCLGDQWVATAQLGTSSDRNFLPEYFEREWFTGTNPETSLEIKKTFNNQSFGLSASYRMDKFYTDTNEIPRFDHYWLGQGLFCEKILWYEHTKLGYNQFRTTESPDAAEDLALFRYLDWELAPNSTSNVPDAAGTNTLSRNSFNFSSRHELDVPLELGPVKVTPYALGEFAFWGADQSDSSISRLYGRGGIRANLPVWKVNSDVSSRTFYLNGLSHKMNFSVDGFFAEANKSYKNLVLYEALDDWQVQDFRRQYSVTTFSNNYQPYQDSIPVRFDERYYAIRHGALGGMVTSPSTEMADDLTMVRFEWQNRWQTKRGPVGNRHITDWITLNTGLNFYPKEEQNFGEYVGLADYDLRWHVGDRFSVLSSGLFDFFDSGQKIIRAGVMSKRPSESSLYLGVDRLSGPIDSTYLNAAVHYRMSPKWAASFSNSYDLSQGENVGQTFGISRIGESFVFTLNTTVSQSKDDWGFSLNILPIFAFSGKKFEEDILGLGPM